jgi:hypothetical protein
MLNWNPPWPMTSDDGRQGRTAAPGFPGNGNAALWSPASMLEYQAYFWSQVIDANRNFWAMCAAAFPGIPAAAVVATKDATEAVMEPAAATHAVEDLGSVIESQTRFWNHLLDANRNLWTGVTWNLPDVPLAEAVPVARAATHRSTASAAKRSRAPARKQAASKSKTQRAH